MSPSQTYAALVTVLVLSGLDQTILSTALPAIAHELHGEDRLSWVFSAYLIASTVVIPLHGKLADRWGTRPLLIAATSLFALGSLACTLAGTMTALILARALQGLGGGGLMTLTMLAVASLDPPEQRGRRMGLLGAAYGLSTMFGPQIGAALVQALSWRWAFGLNVPIALAAGVVVWRSALARPLHARHRLDVAGAALLAGALVALLLAIRRDAGSANLAFGALAIGLLLVWWAVERRAEDPVVPLALFRHRGFASAAAIGAASGIALFSAVVFLPFYLQTALHLSPSLSALHLLPMMLGITTAASLGGRALRAAVPSRRLAAGASFTIAAAFAALAAVLAFAPSNRGWISACLLPVGMGLGLLFPVVTAVSQRCAPPRHLGVATATPIMLRALGGALGVAALGELLAHRVAAQLGAALPPGASLRAPGASNEPLAAAFAAGLEAVFACAAAAGLVAGIVALRGLPHRLPEAAGAAPRGLGPA